MELIILSAVAGALIFGGFKHRASAQRAYWQNMNYYAQEGRDQASERPRLDAALSGANLNAKIAIGVGALILLAAFL